MVKVTDYRRDYLYEMEAANDAIDPVALEAIQQILWEKIHNGNTIFVCGNGGSAAVADHFATDFLKGIAEGSGYEIFPRVVSLSSNMGLITAIGNDLGFQHSFSEQLKSLGNPGDVLIVLSVSGESPNIINAICAADKLQMFTIAITGKKAENSANMLSGVDIHIPSDNYGIVEDIMSQLMHCLAHAIRDSAIAPKEELY